MARKSIRTVPYRRKREQRTDYKKRLELLKSEKARLVVRLSNKNITIQIVEYHPNGDKTKLLVTSKDLVKLGSKLYGNNLPSCYLAGYLLGTKAKGKFDDLILDTGLRSPIAGSRIYAALKGVLDAGVNVRHSKDVLPSEDRLTGKHISEDIPKMIEELKSKIK